jgi:hypothetical protein
MVHPGSQDGSVARLRKARHQHLASALQRSIEDFKRYRAEGGKMQLVLLADFALMKDPKLLPEVAKRKGQDQGLSQGGARRRCDGGAVYP